MNLLNLLKYQLGSNLTGQLSKFLGEDPQKVQSALDATLPAILSVFVKKAADKSGADAIMETIKRGNHDGSMLNYLTGLFSGGSSTNSLMSSGDVLANKFLGNKKTLLTEAVSSFSGTQRTSAASLVKLCMPLILGVIGKQVNNQKLDVTGLMNLLSSQKGHIGASIPSGFAINKLSSQQPIVKTTTADPLAKYRKDTKVDPLAKYRKGTKVDPLDKYKKRATVTTTPPVVTSTKTTSDKKVTPPVKTKTTIKPASTRRNDTPPAVLKYLPFIFGGLLAVILLSFGLRSCSKSKATAATTPKKTTPVTPAKTAEEVKNEEIKEITEVTVDTPKPVEEEIKTTKPNKPYKEPAVASVPSGELKEKLSGMISRGELGESAIPLDGLRFRSGSPVIQKNSRHLIKELAEVLNTNPSLRVKLESSQTTRATSVKKGLMDAGINRDRIITANGGSNGVQMYMY